MFYTLLIIPVIPFLGAAALYGIARLWARHVKLSSFKGIHLAFMCANEDLAFKYGLSCLKASVPFLGIVYNNICIQAFNTFSCRPVRSGEFVVTAAPSIVCYDTQEHQILVGIAILALIIYVIGVPALTLGVVVYARRNDLLRHPDWLHAVGFFYTWYSKSLHTHTHVPILVLVPEFSPGC